MFLEMLLGFIEGDSTFDQKVSKEKQEANTQSLIYFNLIIDQTFFSCQIIIKQQTRTDTKNKTKKKKKFTIKC